MTKSAQVKHFLIDDWLVAPSENLIQRHGTKIHLEPKAMDVLCHLSRNSDRVISAEQLLIQCWPASSLSDSVVYKNIAILRKALGEKAPGSRYIETISKRGYRLHAQVTPIMSTTIRGALEEKENFERALRVLNKLRLKQIQNEEADSLDVTLLKKNSGRLQKISKRVFEYVLGIPSHENFNE